MRHPSRRDGLTWVLRAAAAGALGVACLRGPVAEAQVRRFAPPPAAPSAPHLPELPNPSGWGTHILALARAPDGVIWVGTYGEGIYVLRPGATEWENLRADTAGGSLAWNVVHAFAFGPERDIWYGTVGHGWGLSRDGGRTWRNWPSRERPSQSRRVAPNGIVTRGDTVYVATADGILISADRGVGWAALTDSVPGGLPSRYVLTLAPARAGGLWVSTLRGLGEWRADAGYRAASPSPTPVLGQRIRAVFVVEAPGALVPVVLGGETCAGGMRPRRRSEPARWQCMSALARGAPQGGRAVRALSGCGGVLCAGATSSGAVFGARLGLTVQAPTGPARSRDVYAVLPPPAGAPGDTLYGTACGFLGALPVACLAAGDSAGVRSPATPRHTWFGRPIGFVDQPYVDQTARFGALADGVSEPTQGVAFHNALGTAALAVGDGVVVYAGATEEGGQTLVVRHDSALAVPGGGGSMLLFSVYGHTDRILVAPGERVRRGQEVARVGNTGRVIGSRLHLEIHAAPRDSAAAIVTGPGRPSFARNPELWIEPLPGTGLVAGTVVDGQGRPVRGARVYGLVKPEPQEAPFSYAETYGERALSDPAYQEHFAVGDVPPGEYVLGVEIEGRRVFRRVRVEAGKLTWVEFRP